MLLEKKIRVLQPESYRITIVFTSWTGNLLPAPPNVMRDSNDTDEQTDYRNAIGEEIQEEGRGEKPNDHQKREDRARQHEKDSKQYQSPGWYLKHYSYNQQEAL